MDAMLNNTNLQKIGINLTDVQSTKAKMRAIKRLLHQR